MKAETPSQQRARRRRKAARRTARLARKYPPCYLADRRAQRDTLARIMKHPKFNLVLNWQPVIRRLGRKWAFDQIGGQPWPVLFKTKSEARKMALAHRSAVLERLGK